MANTSMASRVKSAWNAFFSRDSTGDSPIVTGPVYVGSQRPERPRFYGGNERSIITSVYNRIALDVSSIDILHVRLDENNRFLEVINSGLNNCLTIEANMDQSARAFLQDVVISLLDEGCVALVPVDTSIDPGRSSSYDVLTMRTGKITAWYPDHVKVEVYNERTGRKEEVVLPKKIVGIIENPFYSVMNEPSSTLRRLQRKLVLLDTIDENNNSGKLDLIIQLPYTIKSQARMSQADQRRKDIEKQLVDSKYGIAYIDSTEHITQLNRPVENNLMAQVEYLTSMLYSQLGLTQGVLDGSADEKTMLNYYSRTVEPIVAAIADELKRKFLTKTARTQRQSILYFRDPFTLVPVSQIAEIADKFTRNEIMTSNEIRQIVGLKPSDDPKADRLVNSNISQPAGEEAQTENEMPYQEEIQNEVRL